MSEIISLVENEYATLIYHCDAKFIHHTFHQPIGGEAFREVLNTGITTLAEHQSTKWVSDDRENMALSREDTAWSKEDWFPRAVEAGWKYWALVVPQNILARMNMKEFVDSYAVQGLRIRVFSKPEEAIAWIKTCDRLPN